MKENLLKLLETETATKNQPCKDNARLMGESLIYSFGIDMAKPEAPANEEVGFKRTKEFLSIVCETFSDPTHILRVAPFANAYLGTEVFNAALNTVIERAKKHPTEQAFLDDVLTGATLIAPEKRLQFLESVKSAKDISDEMFGLGMLITSSDPKATFNTPDEFPVQFRNQDVSRATSLLGKLIELRTFKPGAGFTAEYEKLAARMKGLDYLVKDPSASHAVLIGEVPQFKTQGLNLALESTDAHNARPNSTGENPGIVFVSQPIAPSEVRRLYPQSTIVYVATKNLRLKEIEEAFGKEVGLVAETNNDNEKTFRAYVNFVREGRENGLVNIADMTSRKLEQIKTLALAGNEHVYDLVDEFEDLGKAPLVTYFIQTLNLKLPRRTNNNLVMLLSSSSGELMPYFEETTGKKVRHFKELPDVEKTGMPFVIVTNKPIKEAEIQTKFPSATVLYFARNDAEEKAITKATGAESFVVNGSSIENANLERAERLRREDNEAVIGRTVAQMFFPHIAEQRPKGIVNMAAISRKISEKIKKVRDEIVFSTGLEDYYSTAVEYWNLQEKFKGVPMIAQQLDGVLMQTCPTGGCLKMTDRPYGGCGANYGRVLIEFAKAYRRQIGEENFAKELERFNKGQARTPWYIDDYRYGREFPKLKPGKKTKFNMTF